MTERPSPELISVASALHKMFCEPGTKPGAVWSDSHGRTCRRNGQKLLDLLHLDGLQVSVVPAHSADRLAKDFLSIR